MRYHCLRYQAQLFILVCSYFIVLSLSVFLTYTLIAPEIFNGNGYNEDVDWWSLGITFYECVYGRVKYIRITFACLLHSFKCLFFYFFGLETLVTLYKY